MDQPFRAPVLDTAGQTPAAALETWREMLAGSIDVGLSEPGAQEGFGVSADLWNLRGMMVGRVTYATPVDMLRSARMARADQVDHYALMLPIDGPLGVEAGGGYRHVEAGSLVLNDMAGGDMRSRLAAGTYLIAHVPREVLDESLPGPLDLRNFVAHGPTAAILAMHLRTLVSHLPQLDIGQAAPMRQATLAMIAAALAPTADATESARPAIEATLLRQISRYVELHLTDPGLTPQALSKVFGLSRTALYRLFEPLGGVASFVRERRLIAVRDKLLAQTARRQPLYQLAEEYGFSSAAHFSTSFRQLFGHSPNEARIGALNVEPAALPAASRPSGSIFNDWLRSLRG